MKKIIYIVCIIIVVLLIFLASKFIIKNNNMLLYAKKVNFGITNDAEDYRKNRTYKVYYDGTMQVSDEYNLSGKKIVKVKEKLTQTEINEIQKELEKENKDKKVNASDGSSWEIKGYDKSGKEIINYNGYIYGKKNLEHIENIIENNCVEDVED